MEFLRDEDMNKVESLIEDKGIIDSGVETQSRLGDPAVEFETPEDWPVNQGGNNREIIGKRLRWLQIVGENKEHL